LSGVPACMSACLSHYIPCVRKYSVCRPRCLEEWGEPYFVTVFKLREKVKELQADVAALRVKCQGDDSEEARNEKMERLMSKLSGKATKRCLMCWKQWHKKRVRSFKRHLFSLILSLRASNRNHAHI
jgi:hypothetical protein